MKKIVTIFLIFGFCVQILNAQIIGGSQTVVETHRRERGEFPGRWKLFGGYVASSVTDFEFPTYANGYAEFRNGFHVGFSCTFKKGNVLIEPGVRYITKGYAEYSGGWIHFKQAHRSNFYFIDTFCKVKLGNLTIEPIRIEPFAGVSGAVLVGNSFEHGNHTVSYTSNIGRMDANLLFGSDFVILNRFVIGYEFSMGLIAIDTCCCNEWSNHRAHIISLGIMF